MEKENINNIVGIHKECADERKNKFQETFDKNSVEVGDYVKKCFTNGNEAEHMWVKVNKVEEDKIIGILDNEPVVMSNVKYKDLVEVEFGDIEEYLK